jgi:hypothetical protein
VALRITDKFAQNPEELLQLIANLNSGIHTGGYSKEKSEPKGQRLILLVDWNSYSFIKRTGHKIFTGLSQGTVKML